MAKSSGVWQNRVGIGRNCARRWEIEWSWHNLRWGRKGTGGERWGWGPWWQGTARDQGGQGRRRRRGQGIGAGSRLVGAGYPGWGAAHASSQRRRSPGRQEAPLLQ